VLEQFCPTVMGPDAALWDSGTMQVPEPAEGRIFTSSMGAP